MFPEKKATLTVLILTFYNLDEGGQSTTFCAKRMSDMEMSDFTAGLPMSYKLGPRWDNVIPWSDFKSETIFGFPSPNFTGQRT